MGQLGSIPGSGRFPEEGYGNPLQSSCLENPMVGYSPRGHKESDTTNQLTHRHTIMMIETRFGTLIFFQVSKGARVVKRNEVSLGVFTARNNGWVGVTHM